MNAPGAGYGNLEVSVNSGRVTSHVSNVNKEKFNASFIPHEVGRYRVDVKFNGEKVANSPAFVEVSGFHCSRSHVGYVRK